MKLPVFRALWRSYSLLFSNIYSFTIIPALTTFSAIELADRLLRTKGISLSRYEELYAQVIATGSKHPWRVFEWLGIELGLMLIGVALITAAGTRYLIGRHSGKKIQYRFGADEIRILLSQIVLVVFGGAILVVDLLLLYGLSIVVGRYSGLLPTWASIPLRNCGFVVIPLMFAAFIWFMVRTSLFAPSAIAEQNLGIRGSLCVTHGNGLRLFWFWGLWSALLFAFYLGMYYVSWGSWPWPISTGIDVSKNMDFNLLFDFVWMLLSTAAGLTAACSAYLMMKEPEAPVAVVGESHAST